MLELLEVKTLKSPALVASSANSSAVDLSDYEGHVYFILHSSASGSGVSNAIKLIEDDASGGSYSDVSGGGFTAVGNSASSQSIRLNSDDMKRYVKLSMTVSGGTGEGIVSCSIIGKKKYR